jgi:hypothetical protein
MGFLDGLLGGGRGLKLERTPEGPRLVDKGAGLSFYAPGEGELIPGFPESPVSPAFDGGFRLAAHPVELRFRIESVKALPGTPPPPPNTPAPPPPEANPQLAHDLCAHYADQRTEGEPLVGVAQKWQLAEWRADGAASTIYPLTKPEGKFDMEETHVLVKAPAPGQKFPQALVLMKLFSKDKVSPALWSELNGVISATLAWGGDGRRPLPRVPSFYVDEKMELAKDARAAAEKLATELRAAGVNAEHVAAAAVNVQRFAFGSDPADAALDAEVRELLPQALLEPIESQPVRAAVERELAQRVKTFRDFRGLHLFLETVREQLTRTA